MIKVSKPFKRDKMKKILIFLLLYWGLYAQDRQISNFADFFGSQKPKVQWIQGALKIIAHFDEVHYREGFGLLVDEGLAITSSEIVYEHKRAIDIVLYNNEVLGTPAACLSHAKILALDDDLGIALLQLESFTDIFCNILPKPNFREKQYMEFSYSILKKPISLIPVLEDEITYFRETDWLNFGRIRSPLRQLYKSQLWGMPLFVRDALGQEEFIGILTQKLTVKSKNNPLDFQKSQKSQQDLEILSHQEILDFLCYLQSHTSILKNYKKIDEFCRVR